MANNISQIEEEDEASEEQKQWMIANDYPLDKYKVDAEGNITERAFREEKQEEINTPIETFAKQFAMGLPGTFAGIGSGALAGAGLGMLGAGPWGAGAGALTVGIGGGLAANKATRALMEEYTPGILKNVDKAVGQNPKSAMIADFAQAAVGGRPSMQGVRTLGQLALNRTLPVATRTASQKALVQPTIDLASNVAGSTAGEVMDVAQGGEFSPGRLAGNIAGGVAFSGRPYWRSANTPAPPVTKLPNGDMLIDSQNRSRSADFIAEQNEGKTADLVTDTWEGRSADDIAKLIAEKIKVGDQKLGAQDARKLAADPNVVNNLNNPIKLEEAIGLLEGSMSSVFQKGRMSDKNAAEKVTKTAESEATKAATAAEKVAKDAESLKRTEFNDAAKQSNFTPNDARYEASKTTPVDEFIIKDYIRADSDAKVAEAARKSRDKIELDTALKDAQDRAAGLTPQEIIDRDSAPVIDEANKAAAAELAKEAADAKKAGKPVAEKLARLERQDEKGAEEGDKMQERANLAKEHKAKDAEDALKDAKDESDKQQTAAFNKSLTESRAHARENEYAHNLERAEYFYKNDGKIDEAIRTRYADEDAVAIRDAKARKAENALINEAAAFRVMSPEQQLAFTEAKRAADLKEADRIAQLEKKRKTKEGQDKFRDAKKALIEHADKNEYVLTRARLAELLNAADPLQAAIDNAAEYAAADKAADAAIIAKVTERENTTIENLKAQEGRRIARENRAVQLHELRLSQDARKAKPVETPVVVDPSRPTPDALSKAQAKTKAEPENKPPAEKPPAPKVERKSKAKKPAKSQKSGKPKFQTATEDVAPEPKVEPKSRIIPVNPTPAKAAVKVETPAVETAAKKAPAKPKAEATTPVKVSEERKAFDEFYEDLENAQKLALDPAKRIDDAVEKGYIKEKDADEAIQMLEDGDKEGAYAKILDAIDTYDTNLTTYDAQQASSKPKNKSRKVSFKDEATPPIDPVEDTTTGYWSPEATASRKADLLSKRIEYNEAETTLNSIIRKIKTHLDSYNKQVRIQNNDAEGTEKSPAEMTKRAKETVDKIKDNLLAISSLKIGGKNLIRTDEISGLNKFNINKQEELLNGLNDIPGMLSQRFNPDNLSIGSDEETGTLFSRGVEGPPMSQKNLEDLLALADRHGIKVLFGSVKDPVTGKNIQGSATLSTRTVVIDPNLARSTTGLHEVSHIIYNEAASDSMQGSLGETAQSTAAYKAEFDARIAEGLTPPEAHKIAMEEGVIRAFADQHPEVPPAEIKQWFHAVKASLKNMVNARLTQREASAWMWIATNQLAPWNNAEGFVPLTNSRVRYNRQEEEFKEAPAKVSKGFKPFRAVLDTVTEMFPKLGNALKSATNERDYKIGQWGSRAESEIAKLSPEKQRTLIDHTYADLDAKTATTPSDATLIPALTEIRAALLKVAQDGNQQGHLIQTVQGNRPRNETESYMPAQEVDVEVLAAFSDPSRGADQAALRDSFLDWTQKQWKDSNKIGAKETAAEYNQRAIDAANEKYNERLSEMQTGGDNQADPTFAGSRKPEGFTLPRSWRSNDLASVFSKYIKRSAIDYATQKHLEVDENVASMIGLPTWNKGEAVTPRLETDHRKNKDVNLALNQFAGVSSNPLGSGAIARTAGLVGALAIGPVSGLSDFTTTSMTGMKYLQPSDYLSGLISFVSKVSKTAELAARSEASGLNDPNRARQVKVQLDLADKTANWMTTATDRITKYTGKNKLEYASRVMAQGWGEVITEHAVANANRGDAESIKFMDNVDPNWRNTDSQNLAASAGRLMQGSYDARQLPAWMINSAAAPYFTWSKWSMGQLNTFTNTAVKPLLNGNPVPLISQLVVGALGGSVVKAIAEWAKNKEGLDPTWEEIGYAIKKKPEKEIGLKAEKLFTLMSAAGTFGFAGDIVKVGIDAAAGNRFRFPMKMPLADFALTSVQRASAMAEAMYKGEDFLDVIVKGVDDEAKQHIQLWQVASNYLDEKENTKAEDRRRKRIFNRMNDLPTGSTTFSQSYENLKEEKLDDMDRNDPALKPMIAQLVREAKLRNPNNREGLKAAIRKLTTVRNDIMPNPQARESRAKATEFMKFADAQLAGGGKELKQRWLHQKQLNEYKKRLIKSKT